MLMLLASRVRRSSRAGPNYGLSRQVEPGQRAKKNARSRCSAAGHGPLKTPWVYRKPGRASLPQAVSEEQRSNTAEQFFRPCRAFPKDQAAPRRLRRREGRVLPGSELDERSI